MNELEMKIASILVVLACVPAFALGQPNEELGKLFSQNKYDEVIKLGSRLIKNDSTDAFTHMAMGRAMAAQEKYTEAIPFLETAAALDRTDSYIKAWALACLGACYYNTGKSEEAKMSLSECIRINATKNATASAKSSFFMYGFDETLKDWTTEETEHLVLHFEPATLRAVRDTKGYARMREAAFQTINDFFASALPKKIDIYVWHTAESMTAGIGTPVGHAEPTRCVVHTVYSQTPGHEITHVISHYCGTITGKTRLINEGVAVCFDQTEHDQLARARQAITGKERIVITIKDIWDDRNLEDRIMYPVGGAFVRKLIDDGGKEKFLEFFKDQSYQHAKKVYGNKLDTIISDFEKSLQEG